MVLTTEIQHRSGTLSDWQLDNPVLGIGELAIVFNGSETLLKVGDGVTAFNDLPFVGLSPDQATAIANAVGSKISKSGGTVTGSLGINGTLRIGNVNIAYNSNTNQLDFTFV